MTKLFARGNNIIMTRNPDIIDECYNNTDLILLKKLTLIIPTYNRTFYLSRCLWYHAHFPFGQIIVADSSNEEKKIVNRDTVSKIREMFDTDILYLEYEPETEKYGGDIYRKWGDAILHVKSDYSEVCTDKEFVIPTASCESISFLEKNPEYINAFAGRGDIIMTDKGTIDVNSDHHITKSYEQNSPIDRLAAFNSDYNIIENLFQIYKTKNLKQIYNNIINSEIDDFRFAEMYLEMKPFIIGKIKQECSIGRIRDNTNISFTTETQEKSSTTQYALLDKYPKERINQLQKKLTELLFNSLNPNYQTEENKILIRDICFNIAWWFMNATNSKYNDKKYRYNKMYIIKSIRKANPTLKYISNIIWSSLPYKIKSVISRLIGYEKGYATQSLINKSDKSIQTIINCLPFQIYNKGALGRLPENNESITK